MARTKLISPPSDSFTPTVIEVEFMDDVKTEYSEEEREQILFELEERVERLNAEASPDLDWPRMPV